MGHLTDKKRLPYQTSLQHLLRNKVNIQYFIRHQLKIYLTSISMILHIWIN